MVAPVIVALVALLTGAQLPALGIFRTASAAVAGVDSAVVDLDKACAATNPLIDQLGIAFPKSKALADVLAASDKLCAAAAGGPGVATDFKLVGLAFSAIAAAKVKLASRHVPHVVPHRPPIALVSAPQARSFR